MRTSSCVPTSVSVWALALCLLLVSACSDPAAPPADTANLGTSTTESRFESAHLGGEVIVKPGVFGPGEAERFVLPLLKENSALFPGKSVLEIGTGSGIISVYAAKLGAAKVVATDIESNALASARENAKRFGVAERFEARLVPASDLSAYSVIEDGEVFDLIISNPPYSLDLEATANTAVTDTGDLGFSIVRGLDRHLKPDGSALLLYNSLFYHLAMVKFARHEGYAVRNHRPDLLTPWETAALFNSYLVRLLAREGVDPAAFRFDYRERHGVEGLVVLPASREGEAPLFPGNSNQSRPGWIVIQHSHGLAREP